MLNRPDLISGSSRQGAHTNGVTVRMNAFGEPGMLLQIAWFLGLHRMLWKY